MLLQVGPFEGAMIEIKQQNPLNASWFWKSNFPHPSLPCFANSKTSHICPISPIWLHQIFIISAQIIQQSSENIYFLFFIWLKVLISTLKILRRHPFLFSPWKNYIFLKYFIFIMRSFRSIWIIRSTFSFLLMPLRLEEHPPKDC